MIAKKHSDGMCDTKNKLAEMPGHFIIDKR